MNLVESMVFVLKNKHQSILSGFIKHDSALVLAKFKRSLITIKDSVKTQFKSLPKEGFKTIAHEVKVFVTDSARTIHHLPKRINKGFKTFKDDFLEELEKQPDQKQKAVFCLKVIGALSSFALGSYTGLYPKKNKGLGTHSVSTLIKRELIFKLSQVLIIRFLDEIDGVLTNPDDQRTVNYFRSILTDENKDRDPEFFKKYEDESIVIVEKLKSYILYGESE